ncbi:unnamed protein product [Somion occarium]|uniref:Nucleolar pre-ribosomal-associated protein 1 n=1 Tax=Somion occarium TaxID=3059160 RepID=A0ABP1D4U5_9APHY
MRIQQTKRLDLSTSQDVCNIFLTRDETLLVQGLTELRDRLTLKYNERVDVQDDRLRLLNTWLSADPGAQSLFKLWEHVNARQHVVLSLVVSILANILALLSSHYTFHGLATPIINSLTSQQWIMKLNYYLTSSFNELVLFTLKLYVALSNFGSGQVRKVLLDEFAWDLKILPKLFHMRRKGKMDPSKNILASPDIRSLFVLFLLSFVGSSSSPNVKAIFLEQRRDLLATMFKGLAQDPYPLLRKVLEVCWDGIWSDTKVRRSLKVALFNESTVSQIIRLYDRRTQEGPDADDIPAELVHHFMLALCTRPGVGICFKDNGWYSREDDRENFGGDDPIANAQGPPRFKIYNKILAGVAKTLRLSDDPRQRELALRILKACPELVAGFWSASSLTLEPRLSSTWIANIAFLGSIISEPPPITSFSEGNEYRSVPPPLSSIIDNILPTMYIKTHLSRGLQSSSLLVQHCTALALIKSLIKYIAVLHTFRSVQEELQEDTSGPWTRRIVDVGREARRRVPDLQVVVAFAQQRSSVKGNAMQSDLLLECSQRLLWLYHKALPSLLAESRFDVAKVLQVVHPEAHTSETSIASPLAGLHTVRQLHALRLLRTSDQFSWSSKTDSTQSNFCALLELYVKTGVPVVQSAIKNVLQETLATSVLFQHDPDEFSLWLDALPIYASDSELPLKLESTVVICFLDECSQRCIKTPFKYIEELRNLQPAQEDNPLLSEDLESSLSPLFMTMLEQFSARMSAHKLHHSDALALLTFLRRLVVRFACKVQSLEKLHPIVARLIAATPDDNGDAEVTFAIRAELRSLCLGVRYPDMPVHTGSDAAIARKDMLNMVDTDTLQATEVAKASVGELIYRLRLSGYCREMELLDRAASTIERWHPTALRELFDYILPLQGHLWPPRDVKERLPQYAQHVDFWLAFPHCEDSVVEDQDCQEVLVSLTDREGVSFVDFKRAFSLVNQRLLNTRYESVWAELLSLLSRLMSKAQVRLAASDGLRLKRYMLQLRSVRDCSSHSLKRDERLAFTALLRNTIAGDDTEKNKLLAEYALYWSHLLRTKWQGMNDDETMTAMVWIPFMDAESLFAVLDDIIGAAIPGQYPALLLEEVLKTLHVGHDHDKVSLSKHVPAFARLQSIVPNSAILEALLADSIEDNLPPFYQGFFRIPSHMGSQLVNRSIARFSGHNPASIHDVHNLDVAPFLRRTTWTDNTTRIIVVLVFASQSTRATVVRWLEHDPCEQEVKHLSAIIAALIDCSRDNSCITVGMLPQFRKLIRSLVDEECLTQRSTSTSGTIALALRCIPHLRSKLLTILLDELSGFTSMPWNMSVLTICQCTVDVLGSEASALVEKVVSNGCRWATALLSEARPCTVPEGTSLTALAELSRACSLTSLSPSLVDTVLSVAVQHHLSEPVILQFIHRTVEALRPKPANINRLLQSIVQHTQFPDLCRQDGSSTSEVKEIIIDLLHFLFHLYPANTCQPSHVEPLGPLYGGSLSTSDLHLLSIFRLYEKERKTSLIALLTHREDESVEGLHSLLILDPGRIFRTCFAFPQWNGIYGLQGDDVVTEDEDVYDPTYVILLFAYWMSGAPPTSALAWVRMFKTNVVCLLIRALSSHDTATRQAALLQLSHLLSWLHDADFAEKQHVFLILDLLKDQFSDPLDHDNCVRLPAYMTLHLAHSLRGVFYPSNFVYPLTARYLLQRPQLDADDVPMLYNMMYSSDDQWRLQQIWIIRFLTDGLVGKKEWQIMTKRHTWDLVASQYQGFTDKTSRHAVLELLARITCVSSATFSLVTKSALLEWVEEQLRHLIAGEEIAWLKVLENTVISMKRERPTSHSQQEWQMTITRCLIIILRSSSCQSDDLLRVVSILRRLDVSHLMVEQVSLVVSYAMKKLEETEATLTISPDVATYGFADQSIPAPPHPSRKLWLRAKTEPLWLWGRTLEDLWQVTLQMERCPCWKGLTYRLLLWRAIVGEQRSVVGEWARRQVLRGVTEQ